MRAAYWRHLGSISWVSVRSQPVSRGAISIVTTLSSVDSPAMPFDEVELSPTRACLGRLYFNVPGGIAYGQHWLNVKFQNSLIRVPFRILTKEEEKFVGKNLKSIQEQVEEAFRPKG